jgi:hypothetical protein
MSPMPFAHTNPLSVCYNGHGMESDLKSPGDTDTTPEIQPAFPTSQADSSTSQTSEAELQQRQRQVMIWGTVVAVLVLALIVGAVYLLLLPSTDTAKIRDVFIIVMALETLVIGMSLIILMIQLARLINLLQNEIKPILESTQETANTLRGTTIFLSDNLAEPVVKLNEYMAAVKSMLEVLRLGRRK